MAVATFTKTGTKATTPAKLNKAVFGVEVANHQLLKDAYLAYLANGRTNLAQTKKRGQVSGGGRKPFRQKGTGRARAGSTRSPLWRGGGITFGPTGDENYSRRVSVTAKRQALRQALTLSATSGSLMVVEAFANMDGKTKDVVKFLAKLGANGRLLLVVAEKDALKQRAASNIADSKVVAAKYLNVYDILNADQIIISKDALTVIDKWLGGKSE